MPSLLPLLALLALDGSALAPPPLARIALAFDARLPTSISRPALEETAAIWAPYGVAIAAPEQPAPCPVPDVLDVLLTVHIEDTVVGSGVWAAPFASIQFLDGVPETTIRLHYENLVRLGLQTGAHEVQWPRSARERVLARMIGRVLAHEVGHWLLRTRCHSATGLMRAVQQATELAEPGRAGFRLDPRDIVRLREMTGR